MPQLIGNIIICKALTVVHDCLEEILDAKPQPDRLEIKLALRFRVAREPSYADLTLVISGFDSLTQLHLILRESIAILPDEDLVV